MWKFVRVSNPRWQALEKSKKKKKSEALILQYIYIYIDYAFNF